MSLMPLARFVIVGLFQVSTVPQRDIGGDFLDVEPWAWGRVGGVKDVVHFFETAEGGLWVEEVDDWEDQDVARVMLAG